MPGTLASEGTKINRMRLALIGSPRAGNTWLRHVIAEALGTPTFAEHAFRDFPDPLPPACVIQIHTYRSDWALSWLGERDVSVIATARHPLDILISVLQFARRRSDPQRWLGGACRVPADTTRLAPEDAEAVAFMAGAGAANLLAVSAQWWREDASGPLGGRRGGVVDRIRYEDALADPRLRLARTFVRLGTTATGDIDGALGKYSVEFFAQQRHHGWIGQAGAYRRFLTARTCEQLRRVHAAYFDRIGYDIDPDPRLTAEVAAANYRASLSP
jgi:hypothetical protein